MQYFKPSFTILAFFLLSSAMSFASNTFDFLNAYYGVKGNQKVINIEIKNKCQLIHFESISGCSQDSSRTQVITISDMGSKDLNCASLPNERQAKSSHEIYVERLKCEPKTLALMETDGSLTILRVLDKAPEEAKPVTTPSKGKNAPHTATPSSKKSK